MTREEELFSEAASLAPAERARLLDRSCDRDPLQRARMEALLVGYDEAQRSLPRPLVARTVPLDNATGDRIGPYVLIEKIGEGGCGVVWQAEQHHFVHRSVALKVIKPGMDSREFIARFEAERQALALMEHPNIAKVFDGGTTESGRPFFVMELVRGVPITRYCDEHSLALRERLELFIQVCNAVQHAHQKGIIHRDLKPSNILVAENDGEPVPKVIDFGIAKATQGRLTDGTMLTACVLLIGTPAYISPEQADLSADIDTRTDIYSLGVLLHELLTGRPPFDPKSLAAAGLDEIRHTLRSIEPLRPSTLVDRLEDPERESVSRRRGVEARGLVAALRGDLDCIVLRCLEKDRTQRYDTANGLALDIRRHLRAEPVAACAPSTAYVLRKFVRRHRVGVMMSLGMLGLGAVGATISVWQAIRATRAEAAEHRRAYISDMNLVQQAIAVDHFDRARELLDRYRPEAGARDVRGWEWRYLWQLCRNDYVSELSGPGEMVTSLAASRDGRWLAMGGKRILNLETRRETLIDAGAPVAFSPRAPVLAAVRRESVGGRTLSRILLWNVETERMIREIPLEAGCARLTFSADGETVFTSSGGRRGEIAVWRVSTGEKIAAFAAPTVSVDGVHDPFVVTGNGTLAAHATESGEVRVIDLRSGRECWTAKAAKEWVVALAFSPNGAVLASAGGFQESTIQLWDVASGRRRETLSGHRSYVNALVFRSDGRTLVSAGGDHTIRVWNLDTGDPVRTLHGHAREIYSLALLPDDVTLVSGGMDGTVFLWDVLTSRSGPGRITMPGRIQTWRFNADGQSMITLDETGTVHRWSGKTFEQKTTLAAIPRTVVGLSSVVLADDAPLLARIRTEGRVDVWDWESQVKISELNTGYPSVAVLQFGARGRKLFVLAGVEPMAGPPWRIIQEWSLPEGRLIQSWPVLLAGAPSAALSPDETTLVAAGHVSGYAWIDVQLRSAVPPSGFRLERGGGRAAFSPDGRYFVGPSHFGQTRIWDAHGWREVATLRGFWQGATSAGFSPDSSRVAVGCGGVQGLTLWTVGEGGQLLDLEVEGSVVFRTAFSPAGDYLGAQTRAGALHLWRAPSWEEIAAEEKGRIAKIR